MTVATLFVVVALVVVAVLVARVIEQRSSHRRAPLPVRASAPAQIDRRDFSGPESPYVLVLFTSTSCTSCEAMHDRVAPLASSSLAVDVCEDPERRSIHEKYAVESVPVLGLYDRAGVARLSWVGPAGAEEIWASVHEVLGEHRATDAD